jgi:hypothetical protein
VTQKETGTAVNRRAKSNAFICIGRNIHRRPLPSSRHTEKQGFAIRRKSARRDQKNRWNCKRARRKTNRFKQQ